MKHAATIVIAAVVGIHCAIGTAPRADDEVVPSTGQERPGAPGPAAPLPDVPPEGAPPVAVTRFFDRQTGVLSRANGGDGVTYVAGLFSGRTALGDFVLKSRGGDDVFLARVEPNGRVAWARSVGSREAESAPEVSVQEDGHVRLFAKTTGEVDCGGGPLGKWSSPMFFMCDFRPEDGTLVSAGAFPTGSP